jgi:hypothetical protein
LLGGGLIGLLFQWFFKIWNRLDNSTKMLIIEAVISTFEKLFRAFYAWYKQQEE